MSTPNKEDTKKEIPPPSPPGPNNNDDDDDNINQGSGLSSSASVSTDENINNNSSCMVTMWSHDDDSVYTGDGLVPTPNREGKEQASNSNILNEPLDFGSIFRTIHAMRCPVPPTEGAEGAERNDQEQGQDQGQQYHEYHADGGYDTNGSSMHSLEDSLGRGDGSTTCSDGDTDNDHDDHNNRRRRHVVDTPNGARLSYTRSFVEQMITSGGDAISSCGSQSNLSSALKSCPSFPESSSMGGMSTPTNGGSLRRMMVVANSTMNDEEGEEMTGTSYDGDGGGLLTDLEPSSIGYGEHGGGLLADLELSSIGDGEHGSSGHAVVGYDEESAIVSVVSMVKKGNNGSNNSKKTLSANNNKSKSSNTSKSASSGATNIKKKTTTTKSIGTGASHVVDQLEDVTIRNHHPPIIERLFRQGGGGGTRQKNNDKEAWFFRHRKKIIVLLALIVLIFGLVIAVVALTGGNESAAVETTTSVTDNRSGLGGASGGGTLGGASTPTTTTPNAGGDDPTGDQDDDHSAATTNSTPSTTTPVGQWPTDVADSAIIKVMDEENLTIFPTALLANHYVNGDRGESTSLLLNITQGSVQTVFVPVDEAFDAVPSRILNKKEWSLHLDKLLRHHMILNTMFLTNELQQAVSSTVQQQYLRMASGETVKVVPKTIVGRVAILGLGDDGDVSITNANLRAGTGVVHVIDGLLRPKFMSMTVMDVLAEQKELSTFTSLIVMAGLESELRDVDAGFTVMAPTNAAFEALHPLTLALLESVDGREVLIETIQQHVLASVLPTTNAVVPLGTKTRLGNGDLVLEKGTSGVMNIDGVTFTSSDELASNGLVHTIGKVLLPDSVEEPAPSPSSLTVPVASPTDSPPDVSVVDTDSPCRFRCPANARRRENRQNCWNSFDDCYCISGYQRDGDACTPTDVQLFVRQCMFICPPNSSKRPNRNCIESFDDCQCNPGYIEMSIGCI